MSYELELIRVEIEDGVATATIDNPPVNVMTLPLMRDLIRLGQQVDDDESVRVLVLKSADPDFFIAHFDVEALLQFPVDSEPERNPDSAFNQMCERFRTMDQVTIAQIEGRAGGGGSELVQAFDMRFGVLGKTRFNQMEVPVGILPGGGVALLRAASSVSAKGLSQDEKVGYNIVVRSCRAPLTSIANNAGQDGGIVCEKVLQEEESIGYNAATDTYEDLVKAGVIDPTKVTRTALQNASSVSTLRLTSDALIAEKPKADKKAAGGHGGDYYMY